MANSLRVLLVAKRVLPVVLEQRYTVEMLLFTVVPVELCFVPVRQIVRTPPNKLVLLVDSHRYSKSGSHSEANAQRERRCKLQ
jgi:hypothetical protein